MKQEEATLPTLLSALIMVGALVVSGHAGKPDSSPGLSKSVVRVTGDISGAGPANQIHVTFSDTFGLHAGTYVPNPDGPLEILGVRKGERTLRYYYCRACTVGQTDCCNDPTHDPGSYCALVIFGGALEGRKDTEQVVFPVGSNWEIRSKEPFAEVVAHGRLVQGVIYKETD